MSGRQTPGSIHEGGELGYVGARDGRGIRQSRSDRRLRRRRWRGRNRAARRRRGRLPLFSTPRVTARCCRSFISTGTRSRARPCSADNRMPTSRRCWRHTAGIRSSCPAMIRWSCMPPVRRGSRAGVRRDPWDSGEARVEHGASGPAAVAGDHPAHAERVDGPVEVDGVQVEGTFRAHQVPLSGVRENPDAPGAAGGVAALLPAGDPVRRVRSTRPRTRSTGADAARCAWARAPSPTVAPTWPTRAAADRRLCRRLSAPRGPRSTRPRAHSASCCGTCTPTRRPIRDSDSSAPTRPTATAWAPCSRSPTAALMESADGGGEKISPDGRVMEVLSEHLCQGWLEGYLLTGRHGLFATYEAFAMVSASMTVQHAKWLQHAQELPGGGRCRASTSCSRRLAGATTTTDSATKVPD